jgi:hypothetical protein
MCGLFHYESAIGDPSLDHQGSEEPTSYDVFPVLRHARRQEGQLPEDPKLAKAAYRPTDAIIASG